MSIDDAPEARPSEVAFALSWTPERGDLVGALEARNVCDHRFRLSGKPILIPIGTNGEPLDAETIVTLELRPPGYVELAPGERATARVGWGGWNGPPASGKVIVRWKGGEVELMAQGPRQPVSAGPATNLWSTWFERAD